MIEFITNIFLGVIAAVFGLLIAFALIILCVLFVIWVIDIAKHRGY